MATRRGISTISIGACHQGRGGVSVVKHPMAVLSWCRVAAAASSNFTTTMLQAGLFLTAGSTHGREMGAQKERSEGEGLTKRRRSPASINRFTVTFCRARSGSVRGGPTCGRAVAGAAASSAFSLLVTEITHLQNRSKVSVSSATLV